MSNRYTLLSRNSLMSVALSAAGALSVVGYGYITKEDAGEAAARPRTSVASLGAAREHTGTAGAASSAGGDASANDDALASHNASANDDSLASGNASANGVLLVCFW